MARARPRFWKAYCDEGNHPGLWKKWYLNQCVAVGWPPPTFSYRDDRDGGLRWRRVKNCLGRIRAGDEVVVHLRGHRIGRIGWVVAKKVEDADWKELVLPTDKRPRGEVGRRVEVRWDLTSGPQDPDDVVQLPEDARLAGGKVRWTLAEISAQQFARIQKAVRNEANWVSLRSRFAHETALSDYIATLPHRLEDGLIPHPDQRVRELHLQGSGRTDVILMDKLRRTVVVECKQGAPTEGNVEQLLRYVRHLRGQRVRNVRAILVHGGATKLPRELRKWRGKVEFVQYRLSVGFGACS